ncbi:MAG TPA: glycosyltransferase family 9 protein [Fimbriimonadaceae bacterium]|nr:glycosyltransferase family 9 protein [Fimbriimonadaceae bacterium]
MGSRPIFRPIFFPMLDFGNPRRVIAICREHIGDIVNSTGALRAIRTRFPDAHIVAEVGERAASVLNGLDSVDEIWSRPTHQGLLGKGSAIRRMARGNFDLAIILDDSNTHIRAAKLAGIPLRVGIYKSKHRDWYTACVDHRMDEHDLFDPLERLVALFGDKSLPPPELAIEPTESRDIDVFLCVGASDPRKAWPLENFERLATLLPSDLRVGQLLAPGEPSLTSVESVATESVQSSAFLMASAKAVVANDSAAAHIAAASGAKAVVIYGPTDPVRFAPWGSGHVLLRSSEVACDLMTTGCRCADLPCESMRTVTPEQVGQAIRQLVSS